MDAKHCLRLCVPVCETTIEAAREKIRRAGEVADFVEIRLDCLTPLEFARTEELNQLPSATSVPVIITFRPLEQGGSRKLDSASRLLAWLSRPGSSIVYRDIELDIAPEYLPSLKPPDLDRLILSHHDFIGVPANIEEICERMFRSPACILKVAVQAHEPTDCIPMFHLLARARRENRGVIAIAMGEAGLATRILGPAHGAFLTYAAFAEQDANAPGQLTIADLRNVYRIHKIDRDTRVMGLVGLPVQHSVSPRMHNAAFEAAAVNGVYIPFPVRDIGSFMRRMIHPTTRELDWKVGGLSVTAPHKQEVMSCLDWIDPAAREIGAVNTVVVEKDALHGYNTDATAFIQALPRTLEELQGARCALIGAGGVARAALWGLRKAGAEVTVLARDADKAAALARSFQARWQPLGETRFDGFDMVVNATPLGTSGPLADQTPALATELRGARLACDLVYNPLETRFLREARAAGCETLGGLPMLVKQAGEQFRLWTSCAAPENVMFRVARETLAEGLT